MLRKRDSKAEFHIESRPQSVDEGYGYGRLVEDRPQEGIGQDHQKLALSISRVFLRI